MRVTLSRASCLRLLFEVEYVGERENVEDFVEGALEALIGGERALQLAEGFLDAALYRLDFAYFERVLFAVLDERDVGLVVDDGLGVLQVVVVAEQLHLGLGLGNERVGDALLEHAVEGGEQGVARLGILAQRADGGDGDALLEGLVDAAGLLHLALQGVVVFGAAAVCADLRLEVAVLCEFLQVLLEVLADAVGLVGIVPEDGVHLLFGALAFDFDFLLGLGNVELERRDDGTRAQLAQMRLFCLQGDVLVGEKEYGQHRDKYPPDGEMDSFLFLLHVTFPCFRMLVGCPLPGGGGVHPSCRIRFARCRVCPIVCAWHASGPILRPSRGRPARCRR